MSAKQSEISAHLTAAVDNIVSVASYQHVDPQVRDEEQDDEDDVMLMFQGPRNTKISIREDEEFLAPYFTCPDLDTLEV